MNASKVAVRKYNTAILKLFEIRTTFKTYRKSLYKRKESE
jgi:hypothetical protein